MYKTVERWECPSLKSLTEEQRRKLPRGQVTEVRRVQFQAFGKWFWRLEVTLLGCRGPLKWRNQRVHRFTGKVLEEGHWV